MCITDSCMQTTAEKREPPAVDRDRLFSEQLSIGATSRGPVHDTATNMKHENQRSTL